MLAVEVITDPPPASARVASKTVVGFIVIATVGYAWAFRRARRTGEIGVGPAWCFAAGLAIALVATVGPLASHAPLLFWVRALQVLLLLYVAPFFLALGRPLTVSAEATGRQKLLGRIVDSPPGRVIGSPWLTSVAMMAVPWLIYFTPWYVASMSGVLSWLTQILLTTVGFGYFYARLQVDPVPRRYTPLLSIAISVAEGLADGVLGVVLWLGPLIAPAYYAAVGRTWGPSTRVDQSIGAGILWLVGDLFSVVFVMVLMRSLGGYERRRAAQVDAELDAQPATDSTLWWENDPQLKERFAR